MSELATMPPELSRWGWRAFVALPILVGLPIALMAYFAGMTNPATTVVGVCVVTAALTAAVTDWLWNRIPNFVTYSTFFAVLILCAIASIGAPPAVTADSTEVSELVAPPPSTPATWDTLSTSEAWRGIVSPVSFTSSLVSGLGCLFLMSAVYSLDGGAGDVKLATCLAAGLGMERGLSMLVWTYVVAGTLMLVIECVRSGPVHLFASLLRTFAHICLPGWIMAPTDEQKNLMRKGVPLGPAFAAGTLITLFGGNLLEGRLS